MGGEEVQPHRNGDLEGKRFPCNRVTAGKAARKLQWIRTQHIGNEQFNATAYGTIVLMHKKQRTRGVSRASEMLISRMNSFSSIEPAPPREVTAPQPLSHVSALRDAPGDQQRCQEHQDIPYMSESSRKSTRGGVIRSTGFMN